MMANSWDQFELLIRDYMDSSVLDLELEDDDPAWNLMGTFQPVAVGGRGQPLATGVDAYPAGYQANYLIKVQSGGRVAGGSFAGNNLVRMGADSHLNVGQSASAKYLDPQKTPLPSHIPITMALKRGLGSITLNHQQILAELATEPVDEVASDAVVDGTKRLRSYVTNAFYADQDTPAAIARINKSAGYSILEATPVEVAVDEGTFARFQMGDLIIAATPGADPAANPHVQKAGAIDGYMRVVNVSPRDRTLYLQSEPGEGTITLVDNDILMYADTYDFTESYANDGSLMPTSFESLVRDSGVFPGSKTTKYPSGLDVANHAVLRGFVSDTLTSMKSPTMEELTELLDLMIDAQGPPTALIAERSIWTLHAILEREAHAVVNVPMGATFQAAGGVAGPVLAHMEHRFQKFSSKRIAPNTIKGMTPGDWMRYIPMGDRTINWVYANGPLAGAGSIFGPTYDGTQLTELADAPFNFFVEFGCRVPQRGLIRKGIKAQRDV